MRIIIIGSTGMIGKALFEELKSGGHLVAATSRNPVKARLILGADAEIHQWDGKSTAPLLQILENYDGVVNLAGENIAGGWWTRKRKQKLSISRIGIGRVLTDAILQMDQKPSFFVQGSASGIYGTRVEQPADETWPGGTGFLADLTKEWESSVHLLEDAGVRVVYLRTGIVLGTNGGMLEKVMLPFRFYAGTIPGNGKQWVSWIHLNDQVRAIRFLTESSQAAGPYNLTAPEPVTMNHFMSAISHIIQKPAWIKIPGILLQAMMGQMAKETILSSQRLIPAKLLKDGFTFHFEQVESALGDLLKIKNT